MKTTLLILLACLPLQAADVIKVIRSLEMSSMVSGPSTIENIAFINHGADPMAIQLFDSATTNLLTEVSQRAARFTSEAEATTNYTTKADGTIEKTVIPVIRAQAITVNRQPTWKKPKLVIRDILSGQSKVEIPANVAFFPSGILIENVTTNTFTAIVTYRPGIPARPEPPLPR